MNKLCYIYTRDYSPRTSREQMDDTGNRKDESQKLYTRPEDARHKRYYYMWNSTKDKSIMT